ncbi:hypothetical protein BVRB_036830, partial [Beta vulgaris subsp. vulgaris]
AEIEVRRSHHLENVPFGKVGGTVTLVRASPSSPQLPFYNSMDRIMLVLMVALLGVLGSVVSQPVAEGGASYKQLADFNPGFQRLALLSHGLLDQDGIVNQTRL